MKWFVLCQTCIVVASFVSNTMIACCLAAVVSAAMALTNIRRAEFPLVWLIWFVHSKFVPLLFYFNDFGFSDMCLTVLGLWCGLGIEHNVFSNFRTSTLIQTAVLCLLPVHTNGPWSFRIKTIGYVVAGTFHVWLNERTRRPTSSGKYAASFAWILFCTLNGVHALVVCAFTSWNAYCVWRRTRKKDVVFSSSKVTQHKSSRYDEEDYDDDEEEEDLDEQEIDDVEAATFVRRHNHKRRRNRYPRIKSTEDPLLRALQIVNSKKRDDKIDEKTALQLVD